MNRVPLIDASQTTEDRRTLLTQIHSAFGATPNMFRAVANSPAALRSMWGSFAALGKGAIPASLGEQIAIAVANRNECAYCLAAHSAIGRKVGLSANELAAAQLGASDDPGIAAVLQFAVRLVDLRGQVDAADLQRLRNHGYDDPAIVEIIAHVALNLFTNYVNIALDVPVDFPSVPLRQAA